MAASTREFVINTRMVEDKDKRLKGLEGRRLKVDMQGQLGVDGGNG
jgi:hypothetical protein